MNIAVKWLTILLFVSLGSIPAYAMKPFMAQCTEVETHRYDGGNGKTIIGEPIADPGYGWSTEKWGNLTVKWSGGDKVFLEGLLAKVAYADDGVLTAYLDGLGLAASNLHSFTLDTTTGEAVYAQVQTTWLGQNRGIKGRVQNLRCAIRWYSP